MQLPRWSESFGLQGCGDLWPTGSLTISMIDYHRFARLCYNALITSKYSLSCSTSLARLAASLSSPLRLPRKTKCYPAGIMTFNRTFFIRVTLKVIIDFYLLYRV